MNLTDEQKAIIHDAIDEMRDRLLRTRVDIAKDEPIRGRQKLQEHDDYTEQVGDLLALF